MSNPKIWGATRDPQILVSLQVWSPGQNCFIKMVFCPNFRVGHVDVALEKWAPITLKIFNKYDWLCLLLFHFSSFLFSSSTLCFFGFHSFLQSLLLCCMWFSPFLRFCAWFRGWKIMEVLYLNCPFKLICIFFKSYNITCQFN